jgi:hypothetical protein
VIGDLARAPAKLHGQELVKAFHKVALSHLRSCGPQTWIADQLPRIAD